MASNVPSGCASPTKGVDAAGIGLPSISIAPSGLPSLSTLTLTVSTNVGPAQAPLTGFADRMVSTVKDKTPQTIEHNAILLNQRSIQPPTRI